MPSKTWSTHDKPDLQAPSSPNLRRKVLERAEQFGQLCVGIDPHEQLLSDWDLPISIDGLREFSRICVEAFAP